MSENVPVKHVSDDGRAGLVIGEGEIHGANESNNSITSKKVDHLPTTATANPSLLSLPSLGPIRPLSPDTLSVLSGDEYDQLHPVCSQHEDASINPLPALSSAAPASGLRGRWQRFWIHNKGLIYMILSQFFATLMNVTTRLLEINGNKGRGLHPFQILFARMAITFTASSAFMWWRRTPHFPFGAKQVRWLLLVRGLAGFFGVFGMYYSLLYLPLADATVITFLAPGLACWACSLLINEPFTRLEQIASLFSIAGVVLIARPTTFFAANGHTGHDSPAAAGSPDPALSANATASTADREGFSADVDNVTPIHRLGAVGVALLGVMGSAVVFTVIRWIGKRAHPLISVNYFAAFCTIVSLVMMIAVPKIGFLFPADGKEWAMLLFLGTCGFVMQFLLAAALAYEKSSRATNMTYVQMLFALAFDKLFFDHTPGLMSIIGSSLILSCAIVVAIQKTPARSGNAQNENASLEADDEESQLTQALMTEVGREVDEEVENERGEGERVETIPMQGVTMREFR